MNTSDNDHTEPHESTPPNDAAEPKVTGETQADVNDQADQPEQQASDESDLPEWEPLTPELAEDEAIRGDFMLRWAVILLALLLGCTVISETATLVHVRTGEYLASHGWLPPTNDVFSYTATDRVWTNQSWLFDIVLAGVFSLMGATGLSILKTLLVVVAFYFIVHITKSEVSTWWGSILAAITLLVCYPQFTARPEVVTLLGLSLTMWFLHQWKEGRSARSLWFLVPVFLAWSNLDHRMFLGLALLLFYAAGESVGSLLGRPGLPDAAHRKKLWIVVGLCFAAALVNPFMISSLTAPFSLYGIEYPNLRTYHPVDIDSVGAVPIERLQFYPMFSEEYRSLVSHHALAGLLLLVTTVVTFVLNRSKLDIGYVFAFLGLAGFAFAGSHELAAAALVCCVLATLNGQEWYRDNFRQTYSVDTGELLFSRGGRAATVLVFFAIAFLDISGRLVGPEGNRIGLGFTKSLISTLDGLRADLEDSFDDRPFHFRLEQGDQLIWLGQKVFVDSRVAVYAANAAGKEDLIELHNKTRQDLAPRPLPNQLRGGGSNSDEAKSDEAKIWKKTFDRFRVTHVLPRLSGTLPDYRTYLALITSEEWKLTRLGAATAIFFRTDTDDPKLKEYLAEHKIDFLEDAFVTDVDIGKSLPPRVDWPQARSEYQNFFSVLAEPVSNPVQQARHYRTHLLSAGGQLAPRMRTALAYLAIRKANQGLSESHENVEAFRILGEMYRFLWVTEANIVRSQGNSFNNKLRAYQAIHAYNQALLLEPDHAETHLALFQLYFDATMRDLALRELVRYEELTEYKTDLTDADTNLRNQLYSIKRRLSSEVDQFSEQVEKALKEQAVKDPSIRFQLAQRSYQSGFVLQALKILEDDRVFLAQNPVAQRLQAICLLEAGRAEEASNIFTRIEEQSAQMMLVNWKFPAGLSKLAYGAYDQATFLWKGHIEDNEKGQVLNLLQSLPLCESPPAYFGHGQDNWPVQQMSPVFTSLYRFQDEIDNIQLDIGLCYLEAGRTKFAAEEFRKILERNPETSLRPLVRFYLIQVTKELDDVPIWKDMFQPPPEAKDNPMPSKPADNEKTAPQGNAKGQDGSPSK